MVDITITSDPKFLVIVRAVVGLMCDLVDLPADDHRKIVLAVDEACTNIMRHTYHGDLSQSIELSCKDCEDFLEIVLKDYGPPIDLDRIAPRHLDEIRPGGLGTHF